MRGWECLTLGNTSSLCNTNAHTPAMHGRYSVKSLAPPPVCIDSQQVAKSWLSMPGWLSSKQQKKTGRCKCKEWAGHEQRMSSVGMLRAYGCMCGVTRTVKIHTSQTLSQTQTVSSQHATCSKESSTHEAAGRARKRRVCCDDSTHIETKAILGDDIEHSGQHNNNRQDLLSAAAHPVQG